MIPNKQISIFFVVTVVLFWSLLISCSEPASERYENENANLSFQLPADWQIMDESSRMVVSPDEALLNEEPFESGIRIQIVSLPISTFDVVDIESLHRSNIQPFLGTPNATLLQPQEELMINGRPAVSSAVSGTNILGVPTIWQSTVIEGETAVVLAFIEASQDSEDRVKEAQDIVSSIELFSVLR